MTTRYRPENLSAEGKHDYDHQNLVHWEHRSITTSVGVFQWKLKSSGKSLKRSAAKVRVKGSASDIDAIIKKANDICKELDAGTYNGPKTVICK